MMDPQILALTGSTFVTGNERCSSRISASADDYASENEKYKPALVIMPNQGALGALICSPVVSIR